jgi:hypothetical protein
MPWLLPLPGPKFSYYHQVMTEKGLKRFVNNKPVGRGVSCLFKKRLRDRGRGLTPCPVKLYEAPLWRVLREANSSGPCLTMLSRRTCRELIKFNSLVFYRTKTPLLSRSILKLQQKLAFRLKRRVYPLSGFIKNPSRGRKHIYRKYLSCSRANQFMNWESLLE